MITITGHQECREQVGRELGVSEWHEVTQGDVDAFADVTRDHQFIHVDVERASQTPFGGTIAHGFYTLSLAVALLAEVVEFEGFSFSVNYGLNRVRFPAPLPVGSNLRMRAALASVEDVAGGLQIVATLTFEREGGDKPVCVAEWVLRLYD